MGEIGELVDAHFPGLGGVLVVLVHGCNVLCEQLAPVDELVGGRHLLVVLEQVLEVLVGGRVVVVGVG